MPIVRYSADEARARARVRPARLKATTERQIAGHARQDGTADSGAALERAVAAGTARIVDPLDVAAIRAKTGLSQVRFARAFRISPHTLRNWEQGRRVPEGPARALLIAIDRAPDAVMAALEG